MSGPPNIDDQLLRGLLDTLVMDLLREGPNYGFGIREALNERLGADAGIVKESTLYPLLHRLAGQGYLASHQEPGDRGRPRRYYRLTEAGVAFLETRLEEWRRVAGVLDRTLLRSPDERASPSSAS